MKQGPGVLRRGLAQFGLHGFQGETQVFESLLPVPWKGLQILQSHTALRHHIVDVVESGSYSRKPSV